MYSKKIASNIVHLNRKEDSGCIIDHLHANHTRSRHPRYLGEYAGGLARPPVDPALARRFGSASAPPPRGDLADSRFDFCSPLPPFAAATSWATLVKLDPNICRLALSAPWSAVTGAGCMTVLCFAPTTGTTSIFLSMRVFQRQTAVVKPPAWPLPTCWRFGPLPSYFASVIFLRFLNLAGFSELSIRKCRLEN